VSLRGRFVAASSVVSLAALSGAFSAVWLVYNAAQERQLDAVLLPEAKDDAVDASLAAAPPAMGRLTLRHHELGPITKYGALYDSTGTPQAWTVNLEQARPRMDLIRHHFGVPFNLWWNNEHLRGVLTAVPGDGERLLLLATPRTDIDGDARDLARKMVAALLIAVVASAVATSWLARVLTRDHDRIAAVARAVAAGDLSARIGALSKDPEIARLGRDVDEMISRLTVLLETQQLFIANASHELRSPIAALLGELSLALRRERDAASYREAIGEALGAARSLKILADDMLTLARIGATDVALERVSLSDVTRAAVESTREAAETKNVRVEIVCGKSRVEGHPGDLTRLLRNLVENAIRHSPPGGSVRIETRSDSGSAYMQVSDDGPGVPPDLRERIFEPFFRLAADRADETGAGLGLAIGRSIARAHGGDLWVDDSARGARFVVRLPLSGPVDGRPGFGRPSCGCTSSGEFAPEVGPHRNGSDARNAGILGEK
jgi:two-component system heavy metal sensor histidine kinase CusS